MTASLKASSDGTQAILQVGGVDTVVIGAQGIESGSFKPGAIRPVDTQVGALPSMVRLNTANGYGSTNTMIRRFSTTVTSQGSDITYTDSATAGASFTINTNGIYAISYSEAFISNSYFGISLNSSQLTTSVISITASNLLIQSTNSNNTYSGAVSWTGYLPAGSVIRPHTAGQTAGTPANAIQFTMCRVA